MTARFTTVVVGGGTAGLATSAHLAAAGQAHVVLERGRVGESWRGRWDGFHLNTPNWMNRLPGERDEAWPPGAFSTRDAFVAKLDRYVGALGLPVCEGVEVEAVRRESDGYAVETSSGSLRATNVVVAGGAQNVPRIPALAERVPAAFEQLHSSDYRRPEDVLPGGVLVIGSAQSGAQIAEELLDAGRRVYLATSRLGRMPRRYRGRDVAEWWREMGWFDVPPSEVEPAVRRTSQALVSGTKGGHTISLQGLARKGALLLGRLSGFGERRAHFAGDLSVNLTAGDRGAQRIRRRIDAHIARAGAYAPVDEPDPSERPLREIWDITSLDLRAEGISTVIWATGFRGDFSWLHMPLRDARGMPFHNGVTLPAPGLYAVGLPWLTRRSSGIVRGMVIDAAEVTSRIAARSEERRLAA